MDKPPSASTHLHKTGVDRVRGGLGAMHLVHHRDVEQHMGEESGEMVPCLE